MTDATNEQTSRTLILPYLNHAARMYEAEYASRADIDAAMRFGCGYATGPLTLIDELGLPSVREQLAERYAETGDNLHRPADLLERLVAEGRLGQVSGRVFYTWDDGEQVADAETPSPDEAPALRHEIASVGVVGAGTMASGIVEVFARSGYDVVYVGRGHDKVVGVRTRIEESLDRAISRGRLDEVVATELTADDVDESVRALCAKVGKVAVSCGDRTASRCSTSSATTSRWRSSRSSSPSSRSPGSPRPPRWNGSSPRGASGARLARGSTTTADAAGEAATGVAVPSCGA